MGYGARGIKFENTRSIQTQVRWICIVSSNGLGYELILMVWMNLGDQYILMATNSEPPGRSPEANDKHQEDAMRRLLYESAEDRGISRPLLEEMRQFE